MKSKKIVLIISMLLITIFLCYVGVQSSISHSAKELTEKGLQIIFLGFVAIMSFTIIYLGYKPLPIFAGSIIMIIGGYTGYNPEIFNNRIENIIHVIATNTAILLMIVEIMRNAVNYFKIKLAKRSLLYMFMIISFLAFTITLTEIKIKNHTYWIEVYFIIVVYLFYIIENFKPVKR